VSPRLRALLRAELDAQPGAIVHFDDPGAALAGPVPAPWGFAPHNVEHRILRGIADASSGPRRWFARVDAGKVEREEHRLWRQATVCFAVSEPDAAAMRAGGARRVELCPNGTDRVAMLPWPRRHPDEPFRIAFVGSGDYRPYATGLRWFVREVLPRVQAGVPASFDVVGSEPRQRVEAAGVSYVGRVQSVARWYERSHAVVVPVFEGSGTRLKILEAAAYGRPVVSTTLGAEGLPLLAGRDYMRADTPESFAAALLTLAKWSQDGDPRGPELLACARAAIEGFFWPQVTRRLIEVYRELCERFV
jgi:glycosyltransferase involved in cell wall biosynthesis